MQLHEEISQLQDKNATLEASLLTEKQRGKEVSLQVFVISY